MKKNMVWSSTSKSILAKPEKKFLNKLVKKIPPFITTIPLTLSSIVWIFLVVIFSYLAKDNINWLWLTSLMIVLHYFTDALDGAVGRYRNEGLVRWGHYMDHFLDYLFLCAILLGYYFLFPAKHHTQMMFLLIIFSAYMVSSFISYPITNKFKYSYLGIGPAEIHIIFILINTLLIFLGKEIIAKSINYLIIISVLGLLYILYVNQKELRQTDMRFKNSKK